MYKHTCKNCGKTYENRKEKSNYCSKKCQYEAVSKNKIINLQGKKFGRLTVLSLKETQNKRRVKWICKCECGNIIEVFSTNLISGTTKSCGCLQKEIAKKTASEAAIYNNLVGQVFNDLTVVEKVTDGMWKCKCKCGNFITVTTRKISS